MTTPANDLLQIIPDSAASWRRLAVALALSTVGGVGLWSSVVVLPAIQAEFGIDRGGASLPYTATLIGFAIGGIMMGRVADRFGIFPPLIVGTLMLALGYFATAAASDYWVFIVAQALLIGMLGSSATFAPLVADVSHWFYKRRGIAVAIVASGNYLSGTIWPPILQYGIETVGWRQTHLGVGAICLVTMLPLAFMLRRRPDLEAAESQAAARGILQHKMPLSPAKLQAVLVLAGVACCVAMAMPQVHMVAYCADLGYGPARGAEMLSIMLGLGVVSRLASGLIADRIGGVGTLILGSTLQCIALIFYLPFDGLASLYVISALFGLSQGGIVPSYALVVRDYFPAREAGSRVSLVLMATVAGMALGGWLSGEIYDLTGSYEAAFLNGIAWNMLNMGIAFWLLASRFRLRPQPA
ncbi:MFS transporter [Pelagibius sp. Alg239-R121]|uniref:MFS transporter n=1 Tax=Pelagibius sp. Alg239-R121 TaxID=2993448 RepID=UPI0024A6727B|nr:MFS transporter [Pelagibius sp. Alg239-R121]